MGWRGEEDEGGSDTRRAGDVIKSGSGMGEGENEEEPTGNEIIETKMEKIEAFLFYIYIYTYFLNMLRCVLFLKYVFAFNCLISIIVIA